MDAKVIPYPTWTPRPGGVSPEEIAAGRSENGGWSRAQLAEWGVPWPPPKGWKDALEDAAAGLPARALRVRKEPKPKWTPDQVRQSKRKRRWQPPAQDFPGMLGE